MTKTDYFEFAKAFFGNCIEIAEKKNADYTGKAPDPFANFSSVEVLGVSTEAGFLTRMMDKIKRVSSFVENGTLQVKDESVKDTLSDLANYCCLFAGYLESKKENTGEEVKLTPDPGFALCTKTLFCTDGDEDFTEGKQYKVLSAKPENKTAHLLNNAGAGHFVDMEITNGQWYQHFIFNDKPVES